MTSKDKALFEIRKHNDFSVLCSDDESEETKNTEEMVVEVGNNSEVQAVDANAEVEGFETFTTVRKVKRVSHSKPSAGFASTSTSTQLAATNSTATRLPGKPKEIIVPKVENSIELYEFPSTLKTNDLRKFLQEFDGHYRLKWINDTSCYVVFDDESLGKKLNLCVF